MGRSRKEFMKTRVSLRTQGKMFEEMYHDMLNIAQEYKEKRKEVKDESKVVQ